MEISLKILRNRVYQRRMKTMMKLEEKRFWIDERICGKPLIGGVQCIEQQGRLLLLV